jgi:hypothetical protein
MVLQIGRGRHRPRAGPFDDATKKTAAKNRPKIRWMTRPADRSGFAISEALTIKIASWPEPIKGRSRAMISEFKDLVVLPIAMVLFLWAASTLPSLTWRSDPPVPIAIASR